VIERFYPDAPFARAARNLLESIEFTPAADGHDDGLMIVALLMQDLPIESPAEDKAR
jgi:hypothetical protein